MCIRDSNFKRLINSYRVVRAKELLDGKDCPVNELFSRCGFASKGVFYVAFRKVVDITLLQYISQNRNPFMIQRLSLIQIYFSADVCMSLNNSISKEFAAGYR